jgi:hypothetical protein
MLAAFKAYERVEKETEYHSDSGFMEIRPAQPDEWTESMKRAAQELNLPWLDVSVTPLFSHISKDHNAESQLGIGYVWANVTSDYKR